MITSGKNSRCSEFGKIMSSFVGDNITKERAI